MLVAGLLLLLTVPPGTAPPPDTSFPATGPRLQVDVRRLAGALHCPATLGPSELPAVLLVHGTWVTDRENWGWNYAQALPALGYQVCTVTLPRRSVDDIQYSAEYVVHAIRAMHRATGQRISVIGHSQGGLQPRWALRFWPDTREMVEDLVMLGVPNHGALVATFFAPLPAAYESALQMRPGSAFLRALNQGDETPGAVSYTSIYSLTDVVVQPQWEPSTSALSGATNIRVQDVCPLRYVSHTGLAADAVVFALVMDALKHDGAADPERLPAGTCRSLLQPRVDLAYGVTSPVVFDSIGHSVVVFPSFSEPALAPYARPAWRRAGTRER